MASRRRRTNPARVAAILALNLAAIAVLWRLWPRAESAAAELAGAGSVPAEPSLRLAPELRAEQRSRLDGDLRRLVAQWTERARRETSGRLAAADLEVAVHVRELGVDPRAAIAIDSATPLRPASNMKLVTTAAALALLGPDGSFETRFDAVGSVREGELLGDLVVRAGADPLYERGGDGDVDRLLAPALDAIAAAGVRSIAGDVVLDEGTYQSPRPGPEWPDEGQWWAEYCALAGGLTAHRGCVSVIVEPTSAGRAARVSAWPRDHGLTESFGVRTEAGGRLSIQIHARESGLLVRGAIPARSERWTDACAHPDPVDLFGRVLCGALARRGVLIRGRLRRERGAPPGETLAVLSTRIESCLVAINTDSTNAVADQLFLATAHAVTGEGTREAGARATRTALERLGVSTEGLVQVDGSGLSRSNRVSAAQIAALIESVLSRDARSAQSYAESLAVAGATGTLDQRMLGTVAQGRVRAKTGFIAGTSALSGVAYALDGRTYIFSILVNYPETPGLNNACWKPMQDAICARLVEGEP
jgi:D-alanyl-D-alanine carboxypeptidase/D-alanyl-D-alanine-endopeptidase (penicillin-binding protein 4)